MASVDRWLVLSLLVANTLCLSACGLEAASELPKSILESVEPEPTTFTAVTYNVENLFDVDGVAIFDSYKQSAAGDPSGYSRAKLLTKLQNIAQVLVSIDEGAGPAIVLFQELEADFTPESSVQDFDAFLKQYSGTSIEAMLGSEWSEDFAGYPSSAWLLKALSDAGMKGYEVVDVPSRGMETGVAHTNAVYSKFPIVSVAHHPVLEARDILVAELNVEGHPLHIYVNHWKSGASNPEREPVRVENAKVLRGLLDAHLTENPSADILVVGDLNSHYNHSTLYPDIEVGINDVLGSDGSEDFSQNDLYNLWFELAPEARYSEVWRGRRGTLMHKLLTKGLYDEVGISYVDGSFDKLVIADLNADAIGRPLRWSDWGLTGGGTSDHFPVVAQFKVGAFEPTGPLSEGNDAFDQELRLDYYECSVQHVTIDGSFLSRVPVAELGPYMGKMYQLNTKVSNQSPFKIRVGGRDWGTYTHSKDLRERLHTLEVGAQVELVVTLGAYRGNEQFVIEWMR